MEADIKVHRLEGNPIVTPNMDPRIGTNLQGPSPIRMPEWLPNPLGKYYLYFADHKGSYIRLAAQDRMSTMSTNICEGHGSFAQVTPAGRQRMPSSSRARISFSHAVRSDSSESAFGNRLLRVQFRRAWSV